VEESDKNPDEEKGYKPSNKRIDDIFHRIIANMPIPGGVNDHGDRSNFEREWDILEKRISDYYLDKRILNKELAKYEKSKI
jgi:hypothetical protein